MLIALTGTPGTGKSTVAAELARRGYRITAANDTIGPYITGDDPGRDARIVDTDRWREEFLVSDGIIEGHLSHLLPADRIIILRCHPGTLKERLIRRGYHAEKIRENVEAEMLDVVLVEALQEHTPEKIYEIDVTVMSVDEAADLIGRIIAGEATPGHGTVDWLSICPDML